MQRHGRLVAKSACIAAVLTAFCLPVIPAKAAEYTMKIALVTLEDTQHWYANKLKEVLEKATKGRVEVKVFPRGQLGSPASTIQGLQLGTIERLVEIGTKVFLKVLQLIPDGQSRPVPSLDLVVRAPQALLQHCWLAILKRRTHDLHQLRFEQPAVGRDVFVLRIRGLRHVRKRSVASFLSGPTPACTSKSSAWWTWPRAGPP